MNIIRRFLWILLYIPIWIIFAIISIILILICPIIKMTYYICSGEWINISTIMIIYFFYAEEIIDMLKPKKNINNYAKWINLQN
jgi:hypothetical protein